MRRLLLLTILVSIVMGINAKQVDVNKAKNVAQQFLLGKSSANATRSLDGLDLVYTATTSNGEQATRADGSNGNLFYVFSKSDNNGFVIVSADDAVTPILAYSRENGFDGENIPCNVKAVLDGYRTVISEAIANGKDASEEWGNIGTRAEETEDGEYLIKSKWGQGIPYNLQTPTIKDSHCVTGCVATAMAQIMYYWKYPEVGHGSKEYFWSNGAKTLTSNFTKPFDWNNMKEEYAYKEGLTEEEADAIGHLMRQCGIAVSMSYDLGESLSNPFSITSALCDYFDYNPNTARHLNLTEIKSNAKWLQIIRDEIADKRPISYNSNGHAYICDGISGDDYLHLNFGWYGSRNGFYKFMTGESVYLNKSDQLILYGIMPKDVVPTKDPEVIVKVDANQSFICTKRDSTINPGESVEFYIYVTMSKNSYGNNYFDSLAVATVDTDGNIIEIKGKQRSNTNPNVIGFSTYTYIYNLYNDTETLLEKKFMPVYLREGQWQLMDNATAIVKYVSPLPSEKVKSIGISQNDITIYSGKDETIPLTAWTDEKGYFYGNIKMTIRDEYGNAILTQTQGVTVNNRYKLKVNLQASLESPGTYEVSYEAFDIDGNKITINDNRSFTITVIDEPNEPYLVDFGFEKSTDFGITARKGQNILMNGIYKNPTDYECTKKIILNNGFSTTNINAVVTKEVTIPSHGETTFSMTLAADEYNPMVLLEYDEMNNKYVYPITNKKLSTPKCSYFYVQAKNAIMQFTKTPSISYDIQNLKLQANTEDYLYFFFDKEKNDIYYAPMKIQLCNDNNVVGEQIVQPTKYDNSTLRCFVNGFDVPAGEYTLKIFLNILDEDFPALDENGNNAEYSITIDNPDLLPQESYILTDVGENYIFSANTQLVKGEESELRYNLENIHGEDFNGTIKVDEAAYVKDKLISYIQSEEKAITIKANSEERAYGTIKVFVPAIYNGLYLQYILLAKSQYDTEYRQIPNVYANINIVENSGINSVKTNNGTTILDGMIIVGNEKTIKSVTVYDMLGRNIGGYTYSSNSVDLRSLSKGIYLVEINTGDNTPIKIKVLI